MRRNTYCVDSWMKNDVVTFQYSLVVNPTLTPSQPYIYIYTRVYTEFRLTTHLHLQSLTYTYIQGCIQNSG